MSGNGSLPSRTTMRATSSQLQKPTDTGSGPAFRMASGKVVPVDNSDYEGEKDFGNLVRLHVNTKIATIDGRKKAGEKILAVSPRGGPAHSAQYGFRRLSGRRRRYKVLCNCKEGRDGVVYDSESRV